MRFCVIHLHDVPSYPDEEVMLLVPGRKVAIAVPLDVLPEFLPILHEAACSTAESCCPACNATLRGARAD
jgi:hypothetical protein